MKFQLLQNLGLDDARHCNDIGASLSLEAKDLAIGSTVDLPEKAVAWLQNNKGYTALLEPAGKIKGEAQKPEITAPSK
jgi:hypothetical protein